MTLYSILLVIHVISVIIWLGFIPADLILRGQIVKFRGKPGELGLVRIYLKLSDITGHIGMTGVLVTGIIMVAILPFYSFFDFSSNHWLATKQILMLIILLLVFFMLLPRVKNLSNTLKSSSAEALSEDETKSLNKVYNALTLINILALINFLLGITHRFF